MANDCENTLRHKGKGRGIMVSEFFLSFGQLGLFHLSSNDRDSLMQLVVYLKQKLLRFFNMERTMMDIGMGLNF